MRPALARECHRKGVPLLSILLPSLLLLPGPHFPVEDGRGVRREGCTMAAGNGRPFHSKRARRGSERHPWGLAASVRLLSATQRTPAKELSQVAWTTRAIGTTEPTGPDWDAPSSDPWERPSRTHCPGSRVTRQSDACSTGTGRLVLSFRCPLAVLGPGQGGEPPCNVLQHQALPSLRLGSGESKPD